MMDVHKKEKYVVHISLLQFYLEMGMKLAKIHRILSYKQQAWIKSYIEFNTNMRMNAKNSFEKDFYKFRSNSIFGKTMENVRKHSDYRLINNSKQLDKLASKPTICSTDHFTEDLVGVKLLKEKCLLNKPIFVGQAVLDISKLLMYKLYYKKLKPNDKFKSIYVAGGDTDSLLLEIKTSHNVDLYKDVLYSMTKTMLDTSNYDEAHFMYNKSNRARLGFFKDETCGVPIKEMILLKPKMYSISSCDSTQNAKRAKGIKKSVVRSFTHEDYRNMYEKAIESECAITSITSCMHTVHTTTIAKTGLSIWEDKRAWIDKNYSLPYGHYSLNQKRKLSCNSDDEESFAKRTHTDV